MKLQIAKNFTLPVEAATQTFAILGIRGSGKTNTAVEVLGQMVTASETLFAAEAR